MESIRTLVADDEPPALSRLRRLLEPHQDVRIIAEVSTGSEAVTAIQTHDIDLVFLDIHMPDLDGFGVVEAIAPLQMPVIVFVTANDQYALRAFEARSLDYLVKPFTDSRFETVLERAREEVRRNRLDGVCGELRSLLDEGASSSDRKTSGGERLVIRSAGRFLFIDSKDVDWIEGAGTYVRLHVGGRSHLMRESLKSLEARLDAEQFMRIHRSAIINTRRVRELRPLAHGEFRLLLHDGTQLKLSRSYRDQLERLVGN